MKKIWIAAVMLVFLASGGYAEDLLNTSGKITLRAVGPLHGSSPAEYPSLLGQIQVDTEPARFGFHMCLEGGWDGSVELPVKDHSTIKYGNQVYQSTTPFVEFKELYGSYSTDFLEVRAGIQRFSWGRLDEYPVNDLLNPWDYSQFLIKSLEDRKIGIPSLSTRLYKESWSLEAVWVPVLIPYRMALNSERWSALSYITAQVKNYPVDILTTDADIPSRNLASGAGGLRLTKSGIVDWGITLFHGYDPRPVLKTTQLVVGISDGQIVIDPGAAADFHKMSSVGVDAAFVKGKWSLRAEAAYAFGRYFNTNIENWGYPTTAALGVFNLNPNTAKSDSLDYGIGADYHAFEDCVLTMQVQQTVILDRPDTLYSQKFETIFWANLRNGFFNQKVQTNLNAAYNPEHGDVMARANAWYVFTDAWKIGVTAVGFWGPTQSLFGRYKNNDQVEVDLVFSW